MAMAHHEDIKAHHDDGQDAIDQGAVNDEVNIVEAVPQDGQPSEEWEKGERDGREQGEGRIQGAFHRPMWEEGVEQVVAHKHGDRESGGIREPLELLALVATRVAQTQQQGGCGDKGEQQEQEGKDRPEDPTGWGERLDAQRIRNSDGDIQQVVGQRPRRDGGQEAPPANQPDRAHRHRLPAARQQPPGGIEEWQEDDEEARRQDPAPVLDPAERQPGRERVGRQDQRHDRIVAAEAVEEHGQANRAVEPANAARFGARDDERAQGCEGQEADQPEDVADHVGKEVLQQQDRAGPRADPWEISHDVPVDPQREAARDEQDGDPHTAQANRLAARWALASSPARGNQSARRRKALVPLVTRAVSAASASGIASRCVIRMRSVALGEAALTSHHGIRQCASASKRSRPTRCEDGMGAPTHPILVAVGRVSDAPPPARLLVSAR